MRGPAATEESVTTGSAPPPEQGPRFDFGANWERFLEVLSEERIAEAEQAMATMLGSPRLDGETFLDVGCGSGLSSVAAMRLGAERVHSFDYDSESVACTRELKRRFFPEAVHWTIEEGDATDRAYLETVGRFDLVYSWGVLHHTGAMWGALENTCLAVAPGGRLFVAISNDQGLQSHAWRLLKRLYNSLPRSLRLPLVLLVAVPLEARSIAGALLQGSPGAYVRSWTTTKGRGMSRWHDLVDWVGGYPFEVAKPEDVFDFCVERGFVLKRLRTTQRLGCNEFVFTLSDD